MFKLEERVLCFHGPLLYEAKVLKIKTESNPTEEEKKAGIVPEKERSYLVHYKGWKRTWDEWVLEDRVRKWNEDNLKQSKELKLAALAAQKKASDVAAQKKTGDAASNGKESHALVEKAETAASRGHKRLRDAETEKDDHVKPSLVLTVPDMLKSRLVDDWMWITKDQRLVPVPRKPSVSQILLDYRLSVPSKRPGSAEAQTFDEVLNGVQDYFDKCLGTILLYRFERQQYADIRSKHGEEARMSEVYGAEHLLRLFVSMPELVSRTQMDPQAVDVLRKYLQDLMRFLANRLGDIFVKEYDVTTADYTRVLNYQ